jgi:hypothetical protein
LAFIGVGGDKLAGTAVMVELFDKVGIGQWFRYFTGLLEVAGGIGLLIPRYAFYAAVLLALVMVGAIIAHVTVGARGVQQLRETMIEVQIAPVRSSVHIPVATLWAHYQGGDVDKGLAELGTQAQTMIDDLLWWTTALKAAPQSLTTELNNRN